MERLEINTDIHCANCVNKLAPHFDENNQITNWSVDLNDPQKALTVEGEGISADLVGQLLNKEGYKITSGTATESESFWSNSGKWKRASFNTLNCLIGCSIGDLGMIIFLQAHYPDTSMAWQMVMAIIAGLITSISLETVILRVREKFNWTFALKTAFGMSFISMVGMEIAMNTTDFVITGGKASFEDPMYWTALIIAMVAGFLAPLPYNYYKLQKYNQSCH